MRGVGIQAEVSRVDVLERIYEKLNMWDMGKHYIIGFYGFETDSAFLPLALGSSLFTSSTGAAVIEVPSSVGELTASAESCSTEAVVTSVADGRGTLVPLVGSVASCP